MPNDDLTTLNLASILTRKYTIDDPHLAATYIRAHASNLLYMMAHKRRPHLDWTATYIFHELSNNRLSAKQLDQIAHIELKQRKREAPPQRSSVSISSDSENHRARRRGPSRSVLRPAAARATARRGTRYAGRNAEAQVGDSDDSDVMVLVSPTKRKSVDEAHGAPRKRAASEVDIAGGSNVQNPPSALEVPSLSPDATPRASPIPFMPNIVSAPLPSTTATLKGQGDTWICNLDGCMHKVYGASEDGSQELIKLHCAEHAVQNQEKIELVRREGLGLGCRLGELSALAMSFSKKERGELIKSRSNLIRRIREMTEAQQGVLPPLVSTGPKFPTAIQRRY
ncbi:hypothetical protein H2199_007388 [Coniosporium tulheliwenetii]|uniref:Uncharacterized protein n=1 Tax=Coniosporium tulheliwenetii TaxID=3383036 RepID=A0ACC2YS83_9PEZI|nr:hypothetical protein H2199_007388 [Cladosporium sp. JES 115]